jgi:hypothetical protein
MRGVVVLATVVVASSAPWQSLQQVKTSNPSVTYEYRGGQELLQAQQNAVTFCNQYGSAPRPARSRVGEFVETATKAGHVTQLASSLLAHFPF